MEYTPCFDVLSQNYPVNVDRVYGKIWRFSQMKNKNCSASIVRIANELNLTRQTVAPIVQFLEANGFIKDTTPDVKGEPHTYEIIPERIDQEMKLWNEFKDVPKPEITMIDENGEEYTPSKRGKKEGKKNNTCKQILQVEDNLLADFTPTCKQILHKDTIKKQLLINKAEAISSVTSALADVPSLEPSVPLENNDIESKEENFLEVIPLERNNLPSSEFPLEIGNSSLGVPSKEVIDLADWPPKDYRASYFYSQMHNSPKPNYPYILTGLLCKLYGIEFNRKYTSSIGRLLKKFSPEIIFKAIIEMFNKDIYIDDKIIDWLTDSCKRKSRQVERARSNDLTSVVQDRLDKAATKVDYEIPDPFSD